MLQPTREEIRVIMNYWQAKIAKNAGRRPNLIANWAVRIEEWREEHRTAPEVSRPDRKSVELIMEQAKQILEQAK